MAIKYMKLSNAPGIRPQTITARRTPAPRRERGEGPIYMAPWRRGGGRKGNINCPTGKHQNGGDGKEYGDGASISLEAPGMTNVVDFFFFHVLHDLFSSQNVTLSNCYLQLIPWGAQ